MNLVPHVVSARASCPGAAMLLFLLPDGQIVLHTGDFRADPTMESYPELLSNRVQTLYLDTTSVSHHSLDLSWSLSRSFPLPLSLCLCRSASVALPLSLCLCLCRSASVAQPLSLSLFVLSFSVFLIPCLCLSLQVSISVCISLLISYFTLKPFLHRYCLVSK